MSLIFKIETPHHALPAKGVMVLVSSFPGGLKDKPVAVFFKVGTDIDLSYAMKRATAFMVGTYGSAEALCMVVELGDEK